MSELPRIIRGLTTNDIKDAQIQVMKSAQAESFGEEYSSLTSDKTLPCGSKLLVLKPRIDEDGLMRSGGRLENAEYLPHNVKYPIILPRKNWVVMLIMRHYHGKRESHLRN